MLISGSVLYAARTVPEYFCSTKLNLPAGARRLGWTKIEVMVALSGKYIKGRVAYKRIRSSGGVK